MWDTTCTDQGLKQRRMPPDVSTCWNSAFDMVDFGILYNQVIESVTDKRQLGLVDFTINEHEWKLLQQLRDVLKVRTEDYIILCSSNNQPQVLKDATMFFSCSMLNLAMVIPTMDFIVEIFTTGMLQRNALDPAIRAAIGLAKKTLNMYYLCTDASKLYCIAMGKQHHLHIIAPHYFPGSFTPSPQAGIFPDHRMGARMDQHGTSTCL